MYKALDCPVGARRATLDLVGRRLYKVAGGLSWLFFLGLALSCLGGSVWVLATAVGGSGVGAWWCRLISGVYAIWLWYDWATPFDGTVRRSSRVVSMLWPILRAAQDFFPLNLVYDFDRALLPEAIRESECPVMLCCHPHGIFSLGILANFGITGGTAVVTQPVTLLTLDMQFYVPVWRELCIALGLASVGRKSMEALLRHKRDLLVVLGGARESLDAAPGLMEITVRPRRGFFRLAMKHGAAVFPVLTLGECELYRQFRHPLLRRIQVVLMSTMSFALPLFWGRFGPVPAPLPLRTIVGAPLLAATPPGSEPSTAAIKAFQERYIKALEDLYEKHALGFYRELGVKVAPKLVVK